MFSAAVSLPCVKSLDRSRLEEEEESFDEETPFLRADDEAPAADPPRSPTMEGPSPPPPWRLSCCCCCCLICEARLMRRMSLPGSDRTKPVWKANRLVDEAEDTGSGPTSEATAPARSTRHAATSLGGGQGAGLAPLSEINPATSARPETGIVVPSETPTTSDNSEARLARRPSLPPARGGDVGPADSSSLRLRSDSPSPPDLLPPASSPLWPSV